MGESGGRRRGRKLMFAEYLLGSRHYVFMVTIYLSTFFSGSVILKLEQENTMWRNKSSLKEPSM